MKAIKQVKQVAKVVGIVLVSAAVLYGIGWVANACWKNSQRSFNEWASSSISTTPVGQPMQME
jgi:apolipoprotein N-acyltransferase